jgi:glyoxylase-like metal-dependent hydrolase (beta-lactamase superfamily II)
MQDYFFIKADKPMWPASANVFAIKDEEGLILIDVGCGLKKFTRKLFKKMNDFGLDIKKVHTIIISHAHPDHMGAMNAILKELDGLDPKILINEIEKDSALNINLLNDSFDMNLPKKYFKDQLKARFGGGVGDINDMFNILCSMSQLPVDSNIDVIKEGDILNLGKYKFKVITTPGHAPGHTSFYEINKNFLLSGDLIGEKGTAWYSPSSGGALGYLSSLEKIENLPDVTSIYPSHGNNFNNVQERITQIREKILLKDSFILNKLNQDTKTVLELVKVLYNDSYSQFFPGLAILESHLIKLEKEGKIIREEDVIRKN